MGNRFTNVGLKQIIPLFELLILNKYGLVPIFCEAELNGTVGETEEGTHTG